MKKLFALLLAGLLAPQRAHADPFDAIGEVLVTGAGVLGLTLAALLVLLAVLSYRQPARPGLRAGVFALLGPSIGVLLFLSGYSPGLPSSVALVPELLEAAVWASTWLGAITTARTAHSDGARRAWTAVAVFAASMLLFMPIRWGQQAFLRGQGAYHVFETLAYRVGIRTVAAVIILVSWWGILRQAVSFPALNAAVRRSWWLVPALVAGLDLAFYLVQLGYLNLRYSGGIAWDSVRLPMLISMAISWAAGVAALHLFPPPADVPAYDRL